MVAYSSFQEEQFRRRVDMALKTVATILDTTRVPRYAEEQDHTYDDKYALADFMTNTAIASYINVLERMGLDQAKLALLCKAVHEEKRSVTLRFAAEDSCTFLSEKDVTILTHPERDHVVETSTETTTTTTGMFGSSTSTTTTQRQSKVSKKVKEFHWKVGVSYKLFCFFGNNPDENPIVLESRSASTVVITSGTKKAPIADHTVHPFVSVSLTWLIEQISPDKQVCQFQIDRSKEDTCRTPRRNEDVNAAFAFFADFKRWSGRCYQHFRNRIESTILGKHDEEHVRSRIETSILDQRRQSTSSTSSTSSAGGPPEAKPVSLASIRADDIFCPILPLFEEPRETAGTATREEASKSLVILTRSSDEGTSKSPLLSVGDIDKFLNEQIRELTAKSLSLGNMFPSREAEDKLITATEASLALLWHHTQFLTIAYGTGIDYIEDMLRKQLIAAVGKEVSQKDFNDFMRFHGKKLFGAEYAPSPFCYAIRQPNHYPDGMLSIESSHAVDKIEPIETTVNFMEDGPSMFMPISAATSVEITGHRYLHGWIQHKFESSAPGARIMPNSDFSLTARARQFSSFLVLTGTISGPSEFTPRDAIILQNKDEVMIPLLLNELPTAKEFKDAISSLSPEQQRFAKAFRGMQLESSVFGVCVVQLKPQLEVLLGLPPNALLKEIRLTQDLLSLFIDYQIPSDLLSFDGSPDVPVSEKVTAVKEHVKAVMDVIEDAKKKQLDEAEQKAEMEVYSEIAESLEDNDGMMLKTSRPSFGGPARMMGRASAPSGSLVMAAAAASGMSGSMPPSGGIPRMRDGSAPPSGGIPERQQRQSASPFGYASGSQRRLRMSLDMVSEGEITGSYETADVPAGEESRANIGPTSVDDLVSTTAPGTMDFTAIPKQLDAKFDMHDDDSALRATIVKTDSTWKRTRKENLLKKAKMSSLGSDDIKSEKDKAFDLLDALSRSGSLPIACAELHVVVAVTHCFEKNVMRTVVCDNVNPIEKVEKTMLLMTSTIHNVPPATLMADQRHSARLAQSFPALFAPSADDESLLEEE